MDTQTCDKCEACATACTMHEGKETPATETPATPAVETPAA